MLKMTEFMHPSRAERRYRWAFAANSFKVLQVSDGVNQLSTVYITHMRVINIKGKGKRCKVYGAWQVHANANINHWQMFGANVFRLMLWLYADINIFVYRPKF